MIHLLIRNVTQQPHAISKARLNNPSPKALSLRPIPCDSPAQIGEPSEQLRPHAQKNIVALPWDQSPNSEEVARPPRPGSRRRGYGHCRWHNRDRKARHRAGAQLARHPLRQAQPTDPRKRQRADTISFTVRNQLPSDVSSVREAPDRGVGRQPRNETRQHVHRARDHKVGASISTCGLDTSHPMSLTKAAPTSARERDHSHTKARRRFSELLSTEPTTSGPHSDTPPLGDAAIGQRRHQGSDSTPRICGPIPRGDREVRRAKR